jgi:hypothetical protein
LHFTGNLLAANRNASLAVSSGTPAISNITRPGRTTATQYSVEPLPLPILVSAGFFDIGLSGKIFIQNFPNLLQYLVIATLAASI